MKTKYLLLFLGIFFCMGIKATEREIILNNCTNKENRVHDERSISIVPTATIDGNTIHIQTNLPVENLQISVKDSYNNIVYSNNDTSCSRSHIFYLNTLSKGEYTIELTIGDEEFYGFFSLL